MYIAVKSREFNFSTLIIVVNVDDGRNSAIVCRSMVCVYIKMLALAIVFYEVESFIVNNTYTPVSSIVINAKLEFFIYLLMKV